MFVHDIAQKEGRRIITVIFKDLATIIGKGLPNWCVCVCGGGGGGGGAGGGTVLWLGGEAVGYVFETVTDEEIN